jgi:hypothetical protein
MSEHETHGHETDHHDSKKKDENPELSDLEKTVSKAGFGLPGYLFATSWKTYAAYALGASNPVIVATAAASVAAKYVIDNYIVRTNPGLKTYLGLKQYVKDSPKIITNFLKSTASVLENIVTFPSKILPAYSGAKPATADTSGHH